MDDVYQSTEFRPCSADDKRFPLLTNDIHFFLHKNENINGDNDNDDTDDNRDNDDVTIRSSNLFLVSLLLHFSINLNIHITVLLFTFSNKISNRMNFLISAIMLIFFIHSVQSITFRNRKYQYKAHHYIPVHQTHQLFIMKILH